MVVVPTAYAAVKGSPSFRTPAVVTLEPVAVGEPGLDVLPLGLGTKAVSFPARAVTVIAAGQVIAGAAVSTTLTVKLQLVPVEELEVTVWRPSVKNEPDCGLLLIVPQLPEPDAAP